MADRRAGNVVFVGALVAVIVVGAVVVKLVEVTLKVPVGSGWYPAVVFDSPPSPTCRCPKRENDKG